MRWATGWRLAAWLAVAPAGVACATEVPPYSPVQTESETRFVSQQLGLANQVAALQAKLGRPVRIDYAMVDLDGDGEGEIFIRLVGGEPCAPGQCQVLVFNQFQGRWAKVLESADPAVTVAKQTHRGYRDILVGSQPWSWSGKAYRMGLGG
jgi:hypothetical protein